MLFILFLFSQAMEMLAYTYDSIPIIFLITDGSVEDERQVCGIVKDHMTNRGAICPRVSTFGIGTYCNHYFLQMLALSGRGHYAAAYDPDSIDVQIQRLFKAVSSHVLANITFDMLEHLDPIDVSFSWLGFHTEYLGP
ncbi:hypothetical protein GIB67_009037 [Kingdonia uniflora]|uniref:VWFA domain-containing protein n=1 Tax=Kingdonia uniflora TaxID=39325 RepID=A0A7J7LVQ4_9MAGN|nr:hypothetical protein GIB67_009037 [Kingdonia uniflora]